MYKNGEIYRLWHYCNRIPSGRLVGAARSQISRWP